MATIRGKAYFFSREPRVSQFKNPDGSDKAPTWQLPLADMSEADLSRLKGELEKHDVIRKVKTNHKQKGDKPNPLIGKTTFTFERKAFKDEDGKIQNYPTVVNKYNEPIAKDVLIGNGSDVIVQYKFRPFTNKGTGQKGYTAHLVGVQVINLIPVEGEKSEFTALEEKPVEEMKVINEEDNDEEIPF